MYGFSNGKYVLSKEYCGYCKKKIIPNGIDPVLFKSDYYHYNCCTWDKKTNEPNESNTNDNKQEEIKAWIRKTKAEIMIKNLKNQEDFS